MKISNYILVLSVLMLSVSCSSRLNSQEATDKAERVNSVMLDSLVQNQAREWIDPLFYIEGQLCQHVRQIFQDSKGILWFGTNVYDIMRYDGDSLTYLSEDDGFDGGRITGILEDADGNIWFASYKGLIKFDGKDFATFNKESGLHETELWSLAADPKGGFWLGTTEGVSYFDGTSFERFPFQKADVEKPEVVYAEDRISAILVDGKGNVWFGTDGFGLSKWDGKKFTHFTKEIGLCDNNIASLMEDRKGNIWIGTFFGGVSKYDGKSFRNYTSEGVIQGVEVSDFYEEKNGDIWFAAENHGVYRYDGDTFTNYTQEDGLNTNGILAFLRDKEDRFWLGGWGGLFRFDGENFVSVTKEGPWN